MPPDTGKHVTQFLSALVVGDYPGKHLWWTLRFVDAAPSGPVLPATLERLGLVWGSNTRTEWVDGTELGVGDRLWMGEGEPGGRIEGYTVFNGARFLKLDLGGGSSRMIAEAALGEGKFERMVGPRNSRAIQLEYEGDLERFDVTQLEAYLQQLHRKHPLVAVVFQEGQWHAGESVVQLDDEQLLKRLRDV